jgi:hypothetical protein
LLALLAVPCASLAAQQEPAEDPLRLIAEAEKRLAVKVEEESLLQLWHARDLLLERPDSLPRQAALLSIATLLRKHDPQDAARLDAERLVAGRQIELAKAYAARKWWDTASGRLDVAEDYALELAAKERAALLAKRPKAQAKVEPKAAEAKPVNPLFLRENTTRVFGSWTLKESGLLESAAHDGGSALSEWIPSAPFEQGQVIVEWRGTDGRCAENFALVLRGRGVGNGYHLRCVGCPEEGCYSLALCAVVNNQYKDLADVRVPPTKVASAFRTLTVQLRGDRLRAWVDTGPVLEHTLSPCGNEMGLAVGIADRPTAAVLFRVLRTGPLPPEEPSEEERLERAAAALQQAVIETAERAGRLAADGQLEAASSMLRESRSQLGRLAPGVLRDNLAASIEASLAKADPLHGKRMQAAKDCAAALVALADRYAAAGLPRLALARVEDAAGFDPAGTAARLAAAAAAVADQQAKIAAARASELAPPADDGTVLREWFAEGRRLNSWMPVWSVEPPAARVEALVKDAFSVLVPKHTMPSTNLVRASMHLPATDATAGVCFDVAGPHDYALAALSRRRAGLELSAYRYSDGEWKPLGQRRVPIEPWRLDGWFEVRVESTATGAVMRAAGAELRVERKHLAVPNGRVGLFAGNDGPAAVTVQVRAFQVVP